jgi:DNA-binding transcriptional LysR family regulator
MASNRLKMSLLPALQAILDTGSVTRAADQMHVTQSTMSRTLSQLREALNDPILVRDGNHIYLSDKARQVQPLVSKLMADSESLFEDQSFDPGSSQHHFRICCGAVMLEHYLVDAFLDLKVRAPGVRFSVVPPSIETIQFMEAGEVDLGIIVTLPDTTEGLCQQTVSDSAFYVLVRKGHPIAQMEWVDLNKVDDYPFVITHAVIAASPYVQSLREQYGFLRNPWLSMPSLQATLSAIKDNDAFTIITNAEYVAMDLFEDFVMVPTLSDSPELKLEVVWPEHWQYNQAHQWVREYLIDDMKGFFAAKGKRV